MEHSPRLAILFSCFLVGSVFGELYLTLVLSTAVYLGRLCYEEHCSVRTNWQRLWIRHRFEVLCIPLTTSTLLAFNAYIPGIWPTFFGIACGYYLAEKLGVALGWLPPLSMSPDEIADTYVSALASAANAGGTVSENDRVLLRSLSTDVINSLGSHPQVGDRVDRRLRSPTTLLASAEFASRIGPELSGHLLKDLCTVLHSEGTPPASKATWFEGFRNQARLDDWSVAHFFHRNVDNVPDRHRHLGTLGLDATADEDRIRKAYRELAKQYHPDRQDAVAPHVRELIAGKMVAINEAYDALTRGSAAAALYFLDAGGNAIVPTGGCEFECRCWLCQQSLRIPGEAVLQSTRCPKCHALAGLDFQPSTRVEGEGFVVRTIADALKAAESSTKQHPHRQVATGFLAVVALLCTSLGQDSSRSRAMSPTKPTLPLKSQFDSTMERGEQFLKAEKYPDAIASFTGAIKLKPDSDAAHARRGSARLWNKETDLAIADLTEAVRLAPGKADHYCELGNAYNLKGETDAALTHLDRAVALDPNSVAPRTRRVIIWVFRGKPDLALGDLNEIIRIDANLPLAYIARRAIWQEKKLFRFAIDDTRQLIRIDPEDPANYRDLSWLLASCSDPACRNGSEAVEMAKAAIRKAGAGVTFDEYGVKAAAHAEAGEFEWAVAEQGRAIAMLRDAMQKGRQTSDPKRIAEYEKVLQLYRRRLPLHQAP